MRLDSRTRSTSYGWYVLGAAFVMLFVNAGARLIIGVMVKPMIAEFGWSRSAVSAVVFLNLAVYAVAVMVTGRLYDRYGPKWVILGSTVLFAGGYMLMARMDSLWQFYLLYGVLAGAGMGGTTTPIFAAALTKWFERRRGLAISLGLAGTSLGQFALVPPFTAMMLAFGWRATLFWVGLLGLAVNALLTFTILRGDPEELGVIPYGRVVSSGRPASAALSVPHLFPRDLTLRQAMRTRSLWLFTAAMFVCGSGDFLMTTHFVPMVTDHGYSAAVGGSLLAWFGLFSLGGILVAGPVSDRFGNRIPIAGSFALRLVVFALAVRFHNLATFYVLAMGFGFSFLVTAVVTPTLSGKLYGFAHIGLISGFITTIHHVGGGLWTYLGGVIFDSTGSYTWAFAASAILSAIALVCTLLIKEPAGGAEGARVPYVAAAGSIARTDLEEASL